MSTTMRLVVALVLACAFAPALAQVPDKEPTYDPNGTWYGYNDAGSHFACTQWLVDSKHMLVDCDGVYYTAGTPFLKMADSRGTAERIGKNEWKFAQVILIEAPWDPAPPFPGALHPTMAYLVGTVKQVGPDQMEGDWIMGVYGPSMLLPWEGQVPMMCFPGHITQVRVPFGEPCTLEK